MSPPLSPSDAQTTQDKEPLALHLTLRQQNSKHNDDFVTVFSLNGKTITTGWQAVLHPVWGWAGATIRLWRQSMSVMP